MLLADMGGCEPPLNMCRYVRVLSSRPSSRSRYALPTVDSGDLGCGCGMSL